VEENVINHIAGDRNVRNYYFSASEEAIRAAAREGAREGPSDAGDGVESTLEAFRQSLQGVRSDVASVRQGLQHVMQGYSALNAGMQALQVAQQETTLKVDELSAKVEALRVGEETRSTFNAKLDAILSLLVPSKDGGARSGVSVSEGGFDDDCATEDGDLRSKVAAFEREHQSSDESDATCLTDSSDGGTEVDATLVHHRAGTGTGLGSAPASDAVRSTSEGGASDRADSSDVPNHDSVLVDGADVADDAGIPIDGQADVGAESQGRQQVGPLGSMRTRSMRGRLINESSDP